MNKKVVIGFDLGTKCGYAVREVESGKILESGTFNMTPKKADFYGKRFSVFRSYIRSLVMQYHDRLAGVAHEEVNFFKAAWAAQVYGGFLAVLTMTLFDLDLFSSGVGTTELKKFAGKGNFKKEDMLAAAKLKGWNVGSADDNEIDAMWVSEYLRVKGENDNE